MQISVSGMTCASCVGRVEKALQKVPGLSDVNVNLANEMAYFQLAAPATIEDALAAVKKAGYQASYQEQSAAEKSLQKEHDLKRERLHLMIAAALSAPLVLPMLFMPFDVHLMPPVWLQWILATPIQFWLGWRFYRAGWRALKAMTGNMDLLVALGTTAAYGLSVYTYLRSLQGGHLHGELHLYFESSAVIITLILLGKYWETKAKLQTTEAIRALQALRPEKANVLRKGQEITLAVEQLLLGDLVIIRPGEKVPADGIIQTGHSHIDESLITGESLPVQKSPGDQVTGGSMNADGLLQVKVTALGAESSLARIIRLVESAQGSKAPIQRLVDKVSSIFVPIVLLIAFITILSWGFQDSNWERAIIHGVAVLVIACPCALGLATPTTIMVGTGLAAKKGILIKDAEALEVAHRINRIAFDKTGTLTIGKPTLDSWQSFDMDKNKFLELAASMQAGSEHPLAKAVLEEAQKLGIEPKMASQMRAIAGHGLEARIDGQPLVLGSRRYMESLHVDLSKFEVHIDEALANGKTLSFIANPDLKKAIGMLTFSDAIKKDAALTVQYLKNLGIKSIMLTGDNPGSAKRVANHLGIDEIRAEILPADKARIISELKNQNNSVVAMVGDGINDAPALAAADVGIAMATGTDVAMHTAAITLMRGDPLLIPRAIEISKRTYSKIRQNLFWAFIYNVIGIPLAALGFLNPMIAAGAMALSSFSVVSNALLLKYMKPSQIEASRQT